MLTYVIRSLYVKTSIKQVATNAHPSHWLHCIIHLQKADEENDLEGNSTNVKITGTNICSLKCGHLNKSMKLNIVLSEGKLATGS